MGVRSASVAQAPRTGVSELDYSRFMSQGMNLASGTDLLNLTTRQEQMSKDYTIRQRSLFGADYIDVLKPEEQFKSVSQETLDKMMGMFTNRKKEVDQKKLMPGSSQVLPDILNMG